MKAVMTWMAAAVIGGAVMATPAEARRSDREGFNFGTNVRVLSGTERTLGDAEVGRETRTESSSNQINPYFGYSFGGFNLGLVYTAETRNLVSEEESADGMTTTTRNSTLNGKGGSIFGRFMFGRVFFFEAGGGLYQEKLEVRTETKQRTADGDGAFTGAEDAYEIKGTGPGYHVAGGLEFAMGAGFYFTTAYQMRMVQLRDLDGNNDLGRKRSQTQKREVLFGIAYYDR